VRRWKCLPEGGELHKVDFNPITKQLGEVVQFASSIGEMHWEDEARETWPKIYQALLDGATGLFGVVTSLAEAQVMRLACLYALLDRSLVVGVPHLEAALEVWRYCNDSARFIFADANGDPTVGAILEALRQAGEGG
jgi:hypothetical protein